MKKVVYSVLETPYWSVLPFRLGVGQHVKYKLEPKIAQGDPSMPDYDDPFYLRTGLHARVRAGKARCRFLVQFQTSEQEMPLDRAMVRWSEDVSRAIHIATLLLSPQDLDTRNQSEYGENLAFGTWHASAEHEPVGSLAAAPKVVYQASADVRRHFSATPIGEPVEPRPGEWKSGVPYSAAKDTQIARARIHPALGMARVGNSKDGDFHRQVRFIPLQWRANHVW